MYSPRHAVVTSRQWTIMIQLNHTKAVFYIIVYQSRTVFRIVYRQQNSFRPRWPLLPRLPLEERGYWFTATPACRGLVPCDVSSLDHCADSRRVGPFSHLPIETQTKANMPNSNFLRQLMELSASTDVAVTATAASATSESSTASIQCLLLYYYYLFYFN